MANENPLSAKLFDRLARCRNGVDHVLRLSRRHQVLVRNVGPQAGVVDGDHRIAEHYPLQKTFPAVIQGLHERWCELPSNAASSMGPNDDRPAACRRFAVRNEYYAGGWHVLAAYRPRVVKKADRLHPDFLGLEIGIERKTILRGFLRANQVAWLALGERIGCVVEL